MSNDFDKQFHSKDMIVSIQEALESVFTRYDWKVVQPTPVIVSNLTEEANRLVNSIYERYGMVRTKQFPESFISYMIGQLQNYEEIMDEVPRPPVIEEVIRPSLLDDATEYDPDNVRDEDGNVEMPEGWADDLFGNADAQVWVDAFTTIMRYNPHWAQDEGYMIGFMSNAIMAGYDTAKQQEHPYTERTPDGYVYIDFYEMEELDVKDQNDFIAEREFKEVVKYTFAFATLDAAQTFVRLNEGKSEMPTFYRMYELSSTTTYKKVPIR